MNKVMYFYKDMQRITTNMFLFLTFLLGYFDHFLKIQQTVWRSSKQVKSKIIVWNTNPRKQIFPWISVDEDMQLLRKPYIFTENYHDVNYVY